MGKRSNIEQTSRTMKEKKSRAEYKKPQPPIRRNSGNTRGATPTRSTQRDGIIGKGKKKKGR